MVDTTIMTTDITITSHMPEDFENGTRNLFTFSQWNRDIIFVEQTSLEDNLTCEICSLVYD